MSDIFFVRLGRRGNLCANLNRVVMEGSRGLGKRLKRQDEGSWTDLKNLRESSVTSQLYCTNLSVTIRVSLST